MQVESELLGDNASPAPEDTSASASTAVSALKAPSAFSSRALLISPPRHSAPNRVLAFDGSFSSSAAISSEHFDEDNETRDEVLQLQASARASHLHSSPLHLIVWRFRPTSARSSLA